MMDANRRDSGIVDHRAFDLAGDGEPGQFLEIPRPFSNGLTTWRAQPDINSGTSRF